MFLGGIPIFLVLWCWFFHCKTADTLSFVNAQKTSCRVSFSFLLHILVLASFFSLFWLIGSMRLRGECISISHSIQRHSTHVLTSFSCSFHHVSFFELILLLFALFLHFNLIPLPIHEHWKMFHVSIQSNSHTQLLSFAWSVLYCVSRAHTERSETCEGECD